MCLSVREEVACGAIKGFIGHSFSKLSPIKRGVWSVMFLRDIFQHAEYEKKNWTLFDFCIVKQKTNMYLFYMKNLFYLPPMTCVLKLVMCIKLLPEREWDEPIYSNQAT